MPDPVEEYVDAAGNRWQLNAADAKRLGYRKAENKQVRAADTEDKADPDPGDAAGEETEPTARSRSRTRK